MSHMIYLYFERLFHCSVSSAISLNASVFASVCLASRLSSALDAFVMVALAVQFFALFPELRSSLRVSLCRVLASAPLLSWMFFLIVGTSCFYITFIHSTAGWLLCPCGWYGDLHWTNILLAVCWLYLVSVSSLALSPPAPQEVS